MDWGMVGDVLVTNLVLVLSIMILNWIIYYFQRNANLLDVAWAEGFLITIVTAFTMCDGYFWRQLILFLVSFSWAARLGGYLFQRYLVKSETGRHNALKEWFQANSFMRFGLLFIIQGLVVVLVSWPFIIIASNPTPSISLIEWIGILLAICGLAGSTMADKELWQFRMDPQNKAKVCQSGFWKYSRHPNYFFEWLAWIGYFLFALDAPLGLTAIISPALMYYILTRISGVKISEEHALKTRGEEYREYQEKTSAFFPWFAHK